jgi:hypothetical protein
MLCILLYKKGGYFKYPPFFIYIYIMPEYNTITFEKHKIIVILDNNKITWFNAKQICLSLN